MQEIVKFIQSNLQVGNYSLTATNLARAFAMSESKLRQDFKASYGMPIGAFIIQLRMEKAKSLLEESRLSIKEAALRLGYDDLANFSRDFKMFIGMRPREYKKKSHVPEI